MDLEEILSLLDSSTVKNQSIVNNPTFSDVHMLESASNRTLAHEDVLCFSKASIYNLLPESSVASKAAFILLDEPLKPIHRNVSTVSFSDREAWARFYEYITDEFRDLRKKKDRLLEVTPMIAASNTLEALLNKFEAIMGAPCSMLDNSLTIIAFSERHNAIAGFSAGDNMKMLPDDAIAWMKARGLINPEKLTDISVFSYLDPQDGQTPIFNHLMPVINHGFRVATISFFTRDHPLRESHRALIPIISQIVALSFQQDQTYLLNKMTYYTHLFTELEQGTFEGDYTVAAKRFSMFGYRLLPFLHVAFVDLSRENISPFQVGNLAKRLHPAFKNSVYSVKAAEVIFLTSSNSATSIDTIDFPLLESALDGSQILVGVSNLFSNPQHTKSAIGEAIRSIEIGSSLYPGRNVYTFHKLRIDDMLTNVSDQRLLYSYRYPPLMEIIKQDMDNGTNLAYTLYTFIQNPDNPKDVAEKLFIHKNTLYYRLEKIRQIIGHDIRDAETVAILQITFHVLKVQGRFKDLVLGEDGVDFHEMNLIG